MGWSFRGIPNFTQYNQIFQSFDGNGSNINQNPIKSISIKTSDPLESSTTPLTMIVNETLQTQHLQNPDLHSTPEVLRNTFNIKQTKIHFHFPSIDFSFNVFCSMPDNE